MNNFSADLAAIRGRMQQTLRSLEIENNSGVSDFSGRMVANHRAVGRMAPVINPDKKKRKMPEQRLSMDTESDEMDPNKKKEKKKTDLKKSSGKKAAAGKAAKKKKKDRDPLLDWDNNRMADMEPQEEALQITEQQTTKQKQQAVSWQRGKKTEAGSRSQREGYVKTAQELQDVILWAEILGEPVSVRRRRNRVNQIYGNQGNAYRR